MKKIYFIFIFVILLFSTSCKAKKFSVKFYDLENELIEEQLVKKGEDATFPGIEKYEKEGFFLSWDKTEEDLLNVSANLDVRLLETESLKTVRFVVNGKVIQEETIKFSKASEKPTLPGYFKNANWERKLEFVDGKYIETFTLNYELVKYSVSFKIDDEVVDTYMVSHGENLILNKEYTAEKGYYLDAKFFDNDLLNITSDKVLEFEKIEYEKNVKYIIDEKIVKEETVKYSNSVTEPIIPSYYENAKWILNETFANGMYTFEYRLSADLITVTYTFLQNDKVIDKVSVKYGENITKPSLTAQKGFYFEFDAKDSDFIEVKADKLVNVVLKEYDKCVKYYIDEEVVKEETLKYSAANNYPNLPENVDTYKWIMQETFENGIYNISYTLSYTIKGGSISYFDGSRKLNLNPASYVTGNPVMLPVYEKSGYIFEGWFLSDISLTRYTEFGDTENGDVKFYARFVEEPKKVTLPNSTYKFTDITRKLHSNGVSYVYQPTFPSDAPVKSVTAYNWTTSDASIATVSAYSSITAKSSGFCELKATLKTDASVTINCLIKVSADGISFATLEDANSVKIVTVTFKGLEGEVLYTQKIIEGSSVVPPCPKVYEGKAFIGWDKDVYSIKEDTTINALYQDGINNYTGKKIAIIGDSISTYQDYIPNGFSCFYPYPTADVNDVNQTWWMDSINKLGASLFVNNSYSGSCVSTGSSATSNDSRLAYTKIANVMPDVIIIYMGSNDAGSPYVESSSFSNKYKEMIDKLQKLCPCAEIILCTLPKSNLYKESKALEFNNIIKQYVNDYDLKLIDLSLISIVENLVDSAHPDKAGMAKISEKVISSLVTIN